MNCRVASIVLCLCACGEGTGLEGTGGDETWPGGPGATTSGAPATTGPGEASSGGADGASSGAISEPWMATSGETGAGSSDSSGSSGADSTTGDPLADCPRLRVTVPDGEVLNVRPTPSTEQAPVAELQDGVLVDTVALVEGEVIDGNPYWYEIASPVANGFVFSGFVMCTTDEPPTPPDGFWLPFECGKQTTVTQGNDGGVSHVGKDLYAFDFGVGLGTPIAAMADGVVQHVFAETGPGDPCYDGGGPECSAFGNLVVVLHGDDTASYYKHLSEVHVTPGQAVTRAAILGLSGTTGYSTGPHLHAMRQGNCGSPKCQSIPLEFVEVGVPVQGDVVVSMNCP